MMWAPTGKGGTNHARKLEKEGLSLGLLTVGILMLACPSGGESVNQGGSGGSAGSGVSSAAGGSPNSGGSSASGGDTGESGGAGGSAPADAVVCKPTSAVINDFSDGECAYGKWGDGEMNTSAWSYGNSTSSI